MRAFAVAATLMAFAVGACGGGSGSNEPPVQISNALSLPAASEDGEVLVYKALRDGLLTSVGVDASSGKELWAAADSPFEPGLGRPSVVENSLFAVWFDNDDLTARIRAVDTSTGDELWSSPLGPHYNGPYECGAEVVCVHAHPEAAPVSTWRFSKDAGEVSEGRAGGRTIYADEDVQLSEIEADATLVLSSDADQTRDWTAAIPDIFGSDHGANHGSEVWRRQNLLVVWLGKADVLDGTFAVFGLQSPEPVATFPGVPCLVQDEDSELICVDDHDDEDLLVVDWNGTVIDRLPASIPEAEVFPDHIYDAAGRLVLLGDVPYRIEPEGFVAGSVPDAGWCPVEDSPNVTETGRGRPGGRPVEIYSDPFYFPCSTTDEQPLPADRGRSIAIKTAPSRNASELLSATANVVSYHAEPSRKLVIAPR